MSMNWAILIILCSVVATCGHKGPLQLLADSSLNWAATKAIVTAKQIREVRLEL